MSVVVKKRCLGVYQKSKEVFIFEKRVLTNFWPFIFNNKILCNYEYMKMSKVFNAGSVVTSWSLTQEFSDSNNLFYKKVITGAGKPLRGNSNVKDKIKGTHCKNRIHWKNHKVNYSTLNFLCRQRSFISIYRSVTVNSNTVNSKFHLIRSFFEIFARFLSFHV